MSGMKVGMSGGLLPLAESSSRQPGMDFMNVLFPGGDAGQAHQLDGRHLVNNESVVTSERLHAPATADDRSRGADAVATEVTTGEALEPSAVPGTPVGSMLAADRAVRRDAVVPRPAPADLEGIDGQRGGDRAHRGVVVSRPVEHANARLLDDVADIASGSVGHSANCGQPARLLDAGAAMNPLHVPVAGPDVSPAIAVEPGSGSAFDPMEPLGLRDPAFGSADQAVTTVDVEPRGLIDPLELALMRAQPAVQGSSLLYPQMLRAVGSLSHLVRSGGALDVSAQAAIDDTSSPVTGPFAGSGGAPGAAAYVEERVASSRMTAPAPGPMHDARTRTAPSAQPATTATLREATVAASIEWPRKLLRLVETEDGTLSCWLRDFTLDEQEARVLVAALRSAADIQGLQVRRIVINGQLAWSHSQGES